MSDFSIQLRFWFSAFFSACLAACCVACAPDVGEYHTYEELEDDLRGLAEDHPGVAKLFSVGHSVEGRDLWGIKISDDVDSDEAEPAVVFLGGHHGREWISVEVPYLLAEHLVEQYDFDPRIRELVDSCEIWIVPLVNPDGHQYSVTTNRFWRKNRRDNGDGTFGVDLNRNYSYRWGGDGSSGDTSAQTYRGPAPFSEPESRAVRDLMNRVGPSAVLSYHNWGQLVLYPWCYTEEPAPDKAFLAGLGQEIAEEISSASGKYYAAVQASENYLLSGSFIDWMYSEQSVPTFDVELRSAQELPGFMLPANQIRATFEENLPGSLFAVEWVVDQEKSLAGQSR